MKSGSTGVKDWQFDEDIASRFVEHARQHIPNYEAVIDKCTNYCELNLPMDAKIIDVGCATGHTLSRLHDRGFTDLYGVDNSEAMIRQAPKDIATYTVGDRFPEGHFDMILCNWTLHFMKDKISYLTAMRDGLSENGTMIISEKISKDPDRVKMYHDQKKRLGVSQQEIEQKQKQLENVMHIDSIDWYKRILKTLGFEVTIIDADWCFATFLCKKEKDTWTHWTYHTGW